MWVSRYEAASKRQNMEWKHTTSPWNKKFKSLSSAGKVIMTLFRDFNWPILKHYQDRGQTVSSAQYSAML
jgi:hypothetical protein